MLKLFFRPLFFLFLLLQLSANAQNEWSLSKCVDYALEHNLQVRLSALNVDQSKSIQDQSYANFLPNLNGQIGHNYYWGRFIDPYTNIYTNQEVQSSNLGLSATVSLFQGLQLQSTLSQSKLNYMASRKELDKVRNDISLNVVAAYLQVLYNQDLYQVLLGQVAATADQAKRMRRMYELGNASKANLLDLEAQLANDSASLVTGQAQVDQSLLSLLQLLELDTVKDFRLEKPSQLELPELPADITPEFIYAAALRTQPEIQGSEFRRLAAAKGLSAAKGAQYPRLFLSGNWNTNYSTSNRQISDITFGPPSIFPSGYTSGGDSVFTVQPNAITSFTEVPFWEQLDKNRGTGLGVTLQLPIFNNWSARNNITRARIALEQSQLNDEITRNNLYKSVQQAVLDAFSGRRKYDANLRSVASLREASAFSRQRFELGLINTYEFALAVNNLARGEANLLQAKYDYLFRLKLLDFYQGKPLTF
ncbi:MAG: hypothetical protein RIQ47_28 [Bacteroidota bacterium]|jgi:outer membrane protein